MTHAQMARQAGVSANTPVAWRTNGNEWFARTVTYDVYLPGTLAPVRVSAASEASAIKVARESIA